MAGDSASGDARLVSGFALGGAVAFFAAGVWFALVEFGVTAPSEPSYEGLEGDASFERFFQWLGDREPQATLVVALTIVAFVCLMLVAWAAAQRLQGSGPLLGARMVGLASGLWIAGSLVDLGGRGAALTLAESDPSFAANINFIVVNVNEGFALTAFALLAVGFLLIGLAARGSGQLRWGMVSLLVAAASLGLAVSYTIASDTLEQVFLAAGGAILMPTWLLLTRGQLQAHHAVTSP